jgi:adenosylcobinamide-phosphate synthase
MNTAALLAVAMVLDAMLGEPKWLWSRAPHPVVIMGRAVDWLDRHLNTGNHLRLRGAVAVAALVAAAWLTARLIAAIPGAPVIETLLAAAILAHRSLVDHLRDVASALRISLDHGRRAVAHIVGRDTAQLDQPAIARAAIESAAENLSDGLIAPAFWFLILGLPGLLVYKIVNTADSMIGYKTPRHADFGLVAARLDDALNLIPARLTALLITIVHLRTDAWPIILRDAPLHRSPNAGWPEAAMAVCLNVALAGPRTYAGQHQDFPLVHPEGRQNPDAADIDAAATALWRTWALALGMVMLLAVV